MPDDPVQDMEEAQRMRDLRLLADVEAGRAPWTDRRDVLMAVVRRVLALHVVNDNR